MHWSADQHPTAGRSLQLRALSFLWRIPVAPEAGGAGWLVSNKKQLQNRTGTLYYGERLLDPSSQE
jgi:hypothetical protein